MVVFNSSNAMWEFIRKREKSEVMGEKVRYWFTVNESPDERKVSSAMGLAKRGFEKLLISRSITLKVTTEWAPLETSVGLDVVCRYKKDTEDYGFLYG